MLFLASCSKDGDAGAKGDKGDPGATGPEGPAGAANVIYSTWLDVPFKPDTIHTSGGKIDTIGYYSGINVPKLTLALLSTSDIKVYVNLNTAADPVIAPLPYVEESGIVIRFVAYEKAVQFSSNVDAGTYQDRQGNKILQYRYVIIPGGVAARKADNINWNDYAAVKAYLGLKD
ncbi:MAG: collagen-like protein [Chitinophagaceae bacterium]